MAITQDPQWHPVLPQITDPDLAIPSAARSGSRAGPVHVQQDEEMDTAPSRKGGFFHEHRFAIIVSIIILLIVIVILFMYLTRRGGKKKADRGDTSGQAPGAGPEEVNLEELNRLRAIRRQARTAGTAASATAGTATAASAAAGTAASAQARPQAAPAAAPPSTAVPAPPSTAPPARPPAPPVALAAGSATLQHVSASSTGHAEEDMDALISSLADEAAAAANE
jgi:hypothetical protein